VKRLYPLKTWTGKVVYPEKRLRKWTPSSLLRLTERVYDPKVFGPFSLLFPRNPAWIRIVALILFYNLKSKEAEREPNQPVNPIYLALRNVALRILSTFVPELLLELIEVIFLPEQQRVGPIRDELIPEILDDVREWVESKIYNIGL